MLELRIARRFLWRSKSQSILIILGIAVGIAVQVFVGSLITSLQESLIESTVGSSSQVTLEPAEGAAAFTFGVADREWVRSQPLVTAVAPVQVLPVLVPVGGSSAPLVVKAGDFADLDSIYKLSSRMVSGEASLQGARILVGKAFAEKFKLGPGDAVKLVPADGAAIQAQIEGVFDLGSQAANTQFAFAGTAAPTALGRPADQVNAVEMQISDVFASTQLAGDLATKFPLLAVTDWQIQNSELLTALTSQTMSSVMIQVFVIIAVMLGIASTLAISAVQKTRQIGILKALGMPDARTGLVFLYQAGILGAVGTALGIVISLGLIKVFSLVAAGSNAGLFPIQARPGFVLLSAGIGMAIALVSAILPYRKTSRLDPIEVIQGA